MLMVNIAALLYIQKNVPIIKKKNLQLSHFCEFKVLLEGQSHHLELVKEDESWQVYNEIETLIDVLQWSRNHDFIML